tara:strand:+ start:263 stop:778 length:516 start_codon:yes stop_codon:yes gene_type:complete
MLSRQYVLKKYAELLGLSEKDTICINLEKSTYNSTIRKTNELGDVPAAENRFFVNRYKHTFLKIKHNLIYSPTLKDRILSGDLKPKSVLELSHQGLWPDGPYAHLLEKNIRENMKKDWVTNMINDPKYKGMFRCNRCKSYKTTFYQMQTRSADEPMTVFVTCHNCNSRWKS